MTDDKELEAVATNSYWQKIENKIVNKMRRNKGVITLRKLETMRGVGHFCARQFFRNPCRAATGGGNAERG